MKKFISILLCAVVLAGSVAGVSYANEDINREDRPVRERTFTFGRFVHRFTNVFDENEYPIISDIKDVIEDNKEIREENKELRQELNDMLKQVKEDGIELEEETKEALKNAKENFKEALEELTEKKEELEEDFNYSDVKAKVQEAMEDESLFNDIATRLLNALNNINERLSNSNEVLEQLVEMVESDLD